MAQPEALLIVIPVILAGGGGTRLAPLSTPDYPKPFLSLPQGGSLLTHTLRRVQGEGWAAPILIGQERHRYALLNHAREAGVRPAAILLEPQAKNTAMAIACVVRLMLRHQPDSVLAILPADHLIDPAAPWRAAIQQAAASALREARPCLLGIAPTEANPHLGYIVPGVGEGAVRAVQAFIEKPVEPERYWRMAYWNAGQCIATPRCLAALFAHHAPHLWEAAAQAVENATEHWEFLELAPPTYAALAVADSFDRMILEPAAAQCAVVPCDTGWHDLGTPESWARATGELPRATADFPRIDRPWGYYELLHTSPGRIEKRLTLYPGCRISLQRHLHRTEQWQVLSGAAEVELDGQFHHPDTSSIIYIEAGTWHRLRNRGQDMLIIHEIQFGNPEEADIERQKDDYGRVIL